MSIIIASIWMNSILSVVIVLTVLGIFIFQKIMTNKFQATLKQWNLILIYIVEFIIFIGAIVGILFIWEYDFGTMVSDFLTNAETLIRAKTGAIFGSILTIFIATLIIKASKLALYHLEGKASFGQKRKKTIAKVSMSIIKYVTYIVTIIVILALWEVNVIPALAGLGMAGLVIGLGAQKFINDLISGFFIIFEHHFDVGDKVEVGGFKGEVTDIGLKTTKIRNWKGEVKIVANGDITTLINFSRNPSIGIVDFGIAYKEDVAKTTELLNKELPTLALDFPDIIEGPKVLGVIELASSSVNLRVIVKTVSESHYGIERAIRQRIKELLDQNKIEIPFPQVVVHSQKE
ncbi:MAG: mechanosensitive ion channel family protein [Firmicutes bacterium]|nr:mechanosensitive ion channel family protein [Bacillota bacterium]